VIELGPDDLAFSIDDAITLIEQDRIDAQLLELRIERSEGWVTGIRLAQLWLEHQGDPVAVVDAFHGSHRDIADYLAEEVFSCLPDDVESFLLATAVPDAFNASLAQALTDDVNAGTMLSSSGGCFS
jgi:LuxR family maltose regulon positive regulatory protein